MMLTRPPSHAHVLQVLHVAHFVWYCAGEVVVAHVEIAGAKIGKEGIRGTEAGRGGDSVSHLMRASVPTVGGMVPLKWFSLMINSL